MNKKSGTVVAPRYWAVKMAMTYNGRGLAKGELVAASDATDERMFGPKATYWATPHDGDAIPCPEDGCNRLFASDSALRAHRVKEHGFVVVAEPVPTAEPVAAEPAKKPPRFGDPREEYYRRLQVRYEQKRAEKQAVVDAQQAEVDRLGALLRDPRWTADELASIRHSLAYANNELGRVKSDLRIFEKDGPTNGGQNVYERAVTQYHG